MNFFVGENSTGKTSVLKVINLLSQNLSTVDIDFNSNNIELGYFSEIANYGENFFEIGYHNEKEGGITAIKLFFIEKEGLPFLTNFIFIDGNFNVEIERKYNDPLNLYVYTYKYEFYDNKQIKEAKNESFFVSWIRNNNLNETPTREFIDVWNESLPLYMTIYMLLRSERANLGKGRIGKYDSLSPSFDLFDSFVWLAPIRTEPRRTYDSYKKSFNPDGTHTPYILKDLIGSDKNIVIKQRIENAIEKFGNESGLFDKIEIVSFEKSETSPFEIRIVLNGHPLKITNVGYGVSQILPIVTEILSRNLGTWFAIQQPEIHLHPRAQAAFGEFIFSFLEEEKKFIIETHSDYLIDRFRLCLNQYHSIEDKNKYSVESQIVFFKRTEIGNELVIIPINPDGSYHEDQPKEFREFFIKEQINLLSI